MIEVVINYDSKNKEYKFYESSSKTLLISSNIGQGLMTLNEFLKNNNFITGDIILDKDNINYHIDGSTLVSMIESNVNLLKQLSSGPSSFSISSSKFNTSKQGLPPMNKFDISRNSFGSSFGSNSSFGKKSGFSKSSNDFGKKKKY